MSAENKELNFELNLLPVISVLAVCICFLLTSTSALPFGTLNVDQAVGVSGALEGNNPPSIWASITQEKDVVIRIKDLDKGATTYEKVIRARANQIDWNEVATTIAVIRSRDSKLKTAMVVPSGKSPYRDVIKMIDQFRRSQVPDVGIAPALGGS